MRRNLVVVESDRKIGEVGFDGGQLELVGAAEAVFANLREQFGDQTLGVDLIANGWSNGYLMLAPAAIGNLGRRRIFGGLTLARTYKRNSDGEFSSGGAGGEFFDEVDEHGNATKDGQVYNDQDISTATRLTPQYLNEFGRPVHETGYGDDKSFSVVLSERGEFHIAADRMDKTPRPGLAKSDQGLGGIREPSDVVVKGITRDGLASLASDARAASSMDAPEGPKTNEATGITVTSRNGGDSVALSIGGRSLGDVAGYVEELDVSVAAHDAGVHTPSNRSRRIFGGPVPAARKYTRDGDGQFSSGGSGSDADPERGARDRQGAIDSARKVGNASAELDQIAAYEATPAAYRNRVDGMRKRGDISESDASAVLKAGEAGDHAAVRQIADRMSSDAGLTPIGRTGDVVGFNPKAHQPLGDRPRDGAKVEVVKRGHDLDYKGEQIRLDKATVDTVGG